MPIYEYECQQCGRHFEALVRGTAKPACPSCQGTDLDAAAVRVCRGRERGGRVRRVAVPDVRRFATRDRRLLPDALTGLLPAALPDRAASGAARPRGLAATAPDPAPPRP